MKSYTMLANEQQCWQYYRETTRQMSADAELLSSLDMYTPVIHVDDYVLLPQKLRKSCNILLLYLWTWIIKKVMMIIHGAISMVWWCGTPFYLDPLSFLFQVSRLAVALYIDHCRLYVVQLFSGGDLTNKLAKYQTKYQLEIWMESF